METPESSRFPAPPGPQAVHAEDGQRIGDAAGALWGAIAIALEPVVGRRGVAALFQHAVCKAASQYPWLVALKAQEGLAADLGQLSALFAVQPPVAAGEAGCALFDAFRDALVALIGIPLGDRLLAPALSQAAAREPFR